MTTKELKNLIISATNEACEHRDLLPNIQAMLFDELRQNLKISDVVKQSISSLKCSICGKTIEANDNCVSFVNSDEWQHLNCYNNDIRKI